MCAHAPSCSWPRSSPRLAAGGDQPPAPRPRALRTSADPGSASRFRPARLTANAGEVSIVMSNPMTSGGPHGVELVGGDLDVAGVTVAPGRLPDAGGALKPGAHAYVCTVPRHRRAGMRGTPTVRCPRTSDLPLQRSPSGNMQRVEKA